MESPIPQRRFRSAANYYLSGRPSYSSLLIRRVVALCALNTTHHILDLGCGLGQLAVAFAPFVQQVTALDPEPEMLKIATKNASSAHLNIKFVQGASFSLSSTSRERLGPKADEFASEIRRLMAGFALEGVVVEVVESTALIARRNSPP